MKHQTNERVFFLMTNIPYKGTDGGQEIEEIIQWRIRAFGGLKKYIL